MPLGGQLTIRLMTSRDEAWARAYGRCEAMVRVRNVWTRCGRRATDVHHMLPRSRGGTLLDELDEIYHLVVLDRRHHDLVHAHPADSYLGGLTIDGQCLYRGNQLIYLGTDSYLTEKYGPVMNANGAL